GARARGVKSPNVACMKRHAGSAGADAGCRCHNVQHFPVGACISATHRLLYMIINYYQSRDARSWQTLTLCSSSEVPRSPPRMLEVGASCPVRFVPCAHPDVPC